MTDPRYQALFEPVKIGPVTAPNRFYQVPHCSGTGYQRPQSQAAMRGMKAEGGWGVVCTEYCSIHHSSDDTPFAHCSLWDQEDIVNLTMMTNAVHEHGSLAGVELWYGGRSISNMYSRTPSYGVQSLPCDAMAGLPLQSQTMTKRDIVDFRLQHRQAAQRALDANFDIVYVYANHHYMLNEFLDVELNQRTDEYGGSLDNRIRLVREVIEDTLEVIQGRAALAVRYSIPADYSDDPNGLVEMFSQISELPDLWDITVTDYALEMGVSRFVNEASNQDAVAKIKSMTQKPVVSVGRFTSPDSMVTQINKGVQDFIGAARPSIADPFLPQKIQQDRLDDIRECIGCNICYAHNSLSVPIRCTQNPTMGDEWARDWHPEKIALKHADEKVLVIGAGPAGLEAARALGQRGYEVLLAESSEELGGRVTKESKLPGLSEWIRVRDWRVGQLNKMANVGVFPQNKLDFTDALDMEAQHIIVATGASWRSDGVGRYLATEFSNQHTDRTCSPERILNGLVSNDQSPVDQMPSGRVVIYDDDHYYMASVMALLLKQKGCEVTLVTPASQVGGFGGYTTEQDVSLQALYQSGVDIRNQLGLTGFEQNKVSFQSVFTDEVVEFDADFLIPVTARLPNEKLFLQLQQQENLFFNKGGRSIQRIGDCRAPGVIAHAVYQGHLVARELGENKNESLPVKRDRVVVRL